MRKVEADQYGCQKPCSLVDARVQTSSPAPTKMKTEKNLQLTKLIAELKKASAKNNSAIWKAIALELEKPTRRRRSVNVYKIDKYSKENETVIVPGKVLGVGDLSKKVNVAAFTFSQEAMQKINQKGQALSIEQLMTKHPDGKNIRILG